MTVFASKIEAGRIMHEVSYGADMTDPGESGGGLGNFKYVPFREGTSKLTLTKPKESPTHVQQRVDGHPLRVTMPKSAVWEFECNADTTTTKAENAVAIPQNYLGLFLETYLGAKNLMTGTRVNDAGADTNDFDVLVPTTLRPGAAIGGPFGTNGEFEVREIKAKATNNITVKYDFSTAPANVSDVFGSATYFANPLTTGAEFIGKSICAVLEGYTTTDKYVCRGGAVTGCEMTWENGQIPKFKFTVTFATWDYADGAAVYADLNGATLGVATYAQTRTLVLADSYLNVGDVGFSDSLAALNNSAISFASAISFQMVRTPGGTMNIAQWVRVHVSPLGELKFTLPYEDQTWFDHRDNDDLLAVMLQIGSYVTTSGDGGVMAFSWPNCQVTDVQRVDTDGISAQEVTLVPRHDTDTTAETSYEGLATSAFRIHMF